MPLTPVEQKVLDAFKSLGARDEMHLKTADDAMRAVKLPKGQINAAITSLADKGALKRVAREKAAGYYVLKETL